MDINTANLTPLMKQYFAIKQEYPDAILLFQVGDFYELFFQDAVTVASILAIALTKRGELNGEPIPLCGFPLHAVDTYIPRLIKAGLKVALCDQLEPATTGKMVSRGVTNVLTPGTLVSDTLLDAKSSNYLLSFIPTKQGYGLFFTELLTSQIHATVLPYAAYRQLESELYRFLPDEVVVPDMKGMATYSQFFKQRGFFTTSYAADLSADAVQAESELLQRHFDPASYQHLNVHQSLMYAAIVWKQYLAKTQKNAFDQFRSIMWYEPEAFLTLDGATQNNLEIIKNSFDASRKNSLLELVDQAVTPMGSRLIKQWLLAPLMDQNLIHQRSDVVATLVRDQSFLQKLVQVLQQFGDMQRIVGRIGLKKAGLSDYVALGFMIRLVDQLRSLMYGSQIPFFIECAQSVPDVSVVGTLLAQSCNDDTALDMLIKSGYDQKLDQMRSVLENSNQMVTALELDQIARTGINSLKIRHNSVQGYYIEITKTHLDNIPDDYVEIATLANRKRYTLKALQLLQSEIEYAQKQVQVYEKELFEKIIVQIQPHVHAIRIVSHTIATIDALVGFARVAYDYGWVQPQFHQGTDIIIQDGKHPMVAAFLQERCIANDTKLTDEASLWIITGPNMGGKSTYLRQVALICLLAQTGSFVPAGRACLPILDRIFTRIGAGDHLAQGKSTFLVEMEETAQILHHATPRSLVILDEVGRGTSTHDGLALAYAIVEHIFLQVHARCLFATHYHELTMMHDQYPGIVPYYAKSVQTNNGIVFLHKIVQGRADGSFGLEVAKLAHIPSSVIARAAQVLPTLMHGTTNYVIPARPIEGQPVRLSQVEQILKELDINDITPRQALDLLIELQQKID